MVLPEGESTIMLESMRECRSLMSETYGFRFMRLMTSLAILPRRLGIICDLGCGDGKFTSLLNEFRSVEKTILLDISRKKLLTARSLYTRKTRERIDYILSDIRYLPFSNNHFDTLVLLEVIEHLSFWDGTKILKDMKRIMKQSGLVLISTPNKNSFTSMTGRLLNSLLRQNWTTGDPSHVYIYTIREILDLIRGEGFKVIRKSGYYILPAGLYSVDRKLGGRSIYNLTLSKMLFKSYILVSLSHIIILLCGIDGNKNP